MLAHGDFNLFEFSPMTGLPVRVANTHTLFVFFVQKQTEILALALRWDQERENRWRTELHRCTMYTDANK